jgi:hypothetical protein
VKGTNPVRIGNCPPKVARFLISRGYIRGFANADLTHHWFKVLKEEGFGLPPDLYTWSEALALECMEVFITLET